MSNGVSEVETTTRKHPVLRLVSAADGYERWAATYDSDPNPLLHREERYLRTVLPSFAGKQVLDLACGTGRWLQKCFDLGLQSGIGVDVSEAMLKMASLKPGIHNRIALADCMALPFGNGLFDLVICSFAVWHVSNVNVMARELARVTKANGIVLLSDLHPEAHARGWRTAFCDTTGSKQIITHPLTVAQLIDSFTVAGMKCLKHDALWLGEPEAPIFVRAGKAHMFADALRVPAVVAFQFRRAESRLVEGRRA